MLTSLTNRAQEEAKLLLEVFKNPNYLENITAELSGYVFGCQAWPAW